MTMITMIVLEAKEGIIDLLSVVKVARFNNVGKVTSRHIKPTTCELQNEPQKS